MGLPANPPPVLLMLAAFSPSDEALDWAAAWATRQWGKIQLHSERFPFVETNYYESTMGQGLKKTFFAFKTLRSPDELVRAKRLSVEAELLYASTSPGNVQRPLNLDPGYLTESKLVLASTKNHAHRIYLGQGIYAEVTLRYQHKQWRDWDWTYPDYQTQAYKRFFSEAREYLRQTLKTSDARRETE